MKKGPVKEIKKDLKKVEKNIKRNWKKIITIAVISLLTLSLILFITGLRISFVFQNDLIIHLNPADASFTIKNNQKQPIDFEVSIENVFSCVADCKYTLYDRSEQKIVDSGEVIIKNKESFQKHYDLEPYLKGSGQKIYNFDVECSNIRTFFCTSYVPFRRKSSFITLNYELTQNEDIAKQELKPMLTKSFSLINNASKIIDRIKHIRILSPSFIKTQFSSDYGSLDSNLRSLIEKSGNIFKLWSSEKYLEIYDLHGPSLLKQSILLDNNSETLLLSFTNSIIYYNSLLSSYNKLENDFLEISTLNRAYVHYSNKNESITDDYNKLYSLFKTSYDKLLENEYESSFEIQEDLIDINDEFIDFNETLAKESNIIIEIGKNLTENEFSKKCYLGYCDNLSNDVCFDILNITNSLYESNNPIGGINYYEKINNSIKILISNESKEYINKYCSNDLTIFNKTLRDIDLISLDLNITSEDPIVNELSENQPMCCVYGECSPCCSEDSCKNESLYPVILVHGHSLLRETSPEPALDIFNKIQYQLQDDGYINAGTIRFDFNASEYKKGDWGLSGFPIVAKASYYYDYFYYLGRYIYITKSADNIDTYAIRLNDMINVIKHRTGQPKINIIAHSMGGLVVRRYIQIFGEASVDKVILIATPNHGVKGEIKSFCHVFGEKKECEDMYADSIFMKKLNSPLNEPKETNFFTISGKGCLTAEKEGDGIVTLESSKLSYAESFVIEGECNDVLKRSLHSDLLYIDRYQEVYDSIKQALEIE